MNGSGDPRVSGRSTDITTPHGHDLGWLLGDIDGVEGGDVAAES